MPRQNIPLLAELPEPEVIDVGEVVRKYAAGEIDLIVILGPTASGKTKYAVKFAGLLSETSGLSAEIISADSRQIYRGMDIGTGKDIEEYGSVPYHLIDIVDAGAQYNVFQFQKDFEEAWKGIRERGCIPILCGGTGLYINAVVNGYDFIDKRPLSEQRSGTVVSGGTSELQRHNPFIIGTLVSREVRNARIDARLDARLKEGMIDEIRGLFDKGIQPERLISYGLEYKYVTLHVLGELSYDEMRGKLAIAIHQFAKRQMTWFRGMERSGTVIHWTEV